MSVPAGQRQQGKLAVIVKALELSTHTIQITSNEKIFDPKYYDAVTSDIIATAKNIYIDCWTANNIKVAGDQNLYVARKELQEKAIRNCNVLLAHISIAKKVFHLDTKKVSYWAKLVVDCRALIRSWRDADVKRYGKP